MKETYRLFTIEEVLKQKTEQVVQSVSTGYESIDKLIGGLNFGTITIVGGRPSMGKTSFILNMLHRSAKKNRVKSLYLSLDSSKDEIITKVLAIESEIDISDIRNASIENKEPFYQAVSTLSKLPVYFNDSLRSIKEIRKIVSKSVLSLGIQVVYIDCLQFIELGVKNNNQNLKIYQIMSELKKMANEERVAIVLTSQLSKSVETRGGYCRPILSDLIESESIERYSDVILFLYRPEYYGLSEWEDDTPNNGEVELIFSKNKHGIFGSLRLRFIGKYVKFKEMELDGAPFMGISEWFRNKKENYVYDEK